MSTEEATDTDGEVSLGAIVATGASVLALWAVSWWLSSLDLGHWNLPVAVGVALVKATLVVLFFMELSRATFSIKLTLVTAAALALTLGAFMVADVMTR